MKEYLAGNRITRGRYDVTIGTTCRRRIPGRTAHRHGGVGHPARRRCRVSRRRIAVGTVRGAPALRRDQLVVLPQSSTIDVRTLGAHRSGGVSVRRQVPKEITYAQRLVDCDDAIERFLDESGGLGAKLGVLLVQLPPSFAYDAARAGAFFNASRSRPAVARARLPSLARLAAHVRLPVR